MLKKSMIAVALAATPALCAATTSPSQSAVNSLAENLDIRYAVVTNRGADDGLACQDLGAEWASCNQVTMTLVNQGNAVTAKDWAIYFHSIRRILNVDSDQFKITHVTGDLHKLEPTDKFDGFSAGETVVLPLIGEYWQLFETDFLPGAFVVAPNAEPKRFVSLDSGKASPRVSGLTGDNLKRTADDNNVIASAVTRYAKNEDMSLQDVSAALIPTPSHITVQSGSVSIAKGIAWNHQVLDKAQNAALAERAHLLGVNLNGQLMTDVRIAPALFKDNMAKSGAYTLKVTPDAITIRAFDDAGVLYAMQSVLGLVDINNAGQLPLVNIEDVPRFAYRGVMVDVARNFHSKSAILATMDQMAAYKMNKLHLHLTDDEGWRIEIPGLPELTDVGAQRCFDLSETRCLLPQLGSGPDRSNFGSGYFSRSDYIEILRYAKARNIEVIPEIDMPAHSRAAVVSMEARYRRLKNKGDEAAANQYRLMDPNDTSNVTTIQFYNRQSFINPCLESSQRFVDKVIAEIASMHREAGMPLTTWHFGGDEAKNIKLGAGFQDIRATDKVSWKGNIDLSEQDKPFARSPACQTLIANGEITDVEHLPSYFAEQVSKQAVKQGIPYFQAWQDGLKYSKGAESFASQSTRVNFWDTLYWGGTSSAYEYVQKGYDVIVSNPDYVYMDMPYEVDPKESGYYWATRATDTRKLFSFAPENLPQNAETSVDRDGNGFPGKGEVRAKPFYGLSAQLFSEVVRSDEQYEYMVFPRVLAAAERAWHRASWENDYQPGLEYSQDTRRVDQSALNADWNRFANILGQRELAKLEKSGIDYRLPIPGAKIESGRLAMNVQFPGVRLQYSLNGNTWLNYDATDAPSVTGKVWIRSRSVSGKRFSRVTTVN